MQDTIERMEMVPTWEAVVLASKAVLPTPEAATTSQ